MERDLGETTARTRSRLAAFFFFQFLMPVIQVLMTLCAMTSSKGNRDISRSRFEKVHKINSLLDNFLPVYNLVQSPQRMQILLAPFLFLHETSQLSFRAFTWHNLLIIKKFKKFVYIKNVCFFHLPSSSCTPFLLLFLNHGNLHWLHKDTSRRLDGIRSMQKKSAGQSATQTVLKRENPDSIRLRFCLGWKRGWHASLDWWPHLVP